MCCLGTYSASQSLDILFYWRYQIWQQMVGSISYPRNREGVRRPYHDCKCQFHYLINPNPNCIYLTMEDINYSKKRKQENEYELNFTTQFPCMTFEMHLLKRFFHYLTIYMDRTKWCLQSYYIHQVVGSSCTCLNHLGIRWEVEKIETSLIDNIF